MLISKNVDNNVNESGYTLKTAYKACCMHINFVVLNAFEGEKCIKAIIAYQLFQG